jgi:outer membrane protein
MRRFLLIIISFLSLSAFAQGDGNVPQTDSLPAPVVRFGYLSYDSALRAMPQYAVVHQQLTDLREAYRQEMSRVEQEFNEKYEAFLEGQRDFPRTILLKRQTELQQLMQRNIDFKAQAQRDLQQAETEAMQPLRQQLNDALATVARNQGLALIINTDSNACPFIDPLFGEDVQEAVQTLLSN